jgi:prevent-host-death family protein
MKMVNVHEAKTNLSRLLQKVEAGEEIIIAKAGKPVARLVPEIPKKRKRTLGTMRGKFAVPGNFDDPWPEYERLFYGGHSAE